MVFYGLFAMPYDLCSYVSPFSFVFLRLSFVFGLLRTSLVYEPHVDYRLNEYDPPYCSYLRLRASASLRILPATPRLFPARPLPPTCPCLTAGSTALALLTCFRVYRFPRVRALSRSIRDTSAPYCDPFASSRLVRARRDYFALYRDITATQLRVRAHLLCRS